MGHSAQIIENGEFQSLWRRVKKGDPEAIGRVYSFHWESVLASSCMVLGRRLDAEVEDLVENAFVEILFKSASKFDFEHAGKLKGLLINNVVWRNRDRLKRLPPTQSLSAIPEAILASSDKAAHEEIEVKEERLEQQQEMDALLSAISELGDYQRVAVVLHFMEGLSYKAIEEITGRKENSIKQDIYRAKDFLRKRLGVLPTEG